MSERVLHEFAVDDSDFEGYRFRIMVSGEGIWRELRIGDGVWESDPEPSFHDTLEILRLADALAEAEARARRARVEGMREAFTAMKYEHDLEHTNTGHCVDSVRRLIAAAERELREDEG